MSDSPALDAVAESGVAYGVVRFEPARDLPEAAERRGTTVDRILPILVDDDLIEGVGAVPVHTTKSAGEPR